MIIGTAVIKLSAPWVHSLKEKRMTVNSIIDKTRNKFNISIREVDMMDLHQTIVLGVSCASNSSNHASSVIDHVVNFIEDHFETVVLDVSIELL